VKRSLRRRTPLQSRRREKKHALPRPGVTPPMPKGWRALSAWVKHRDGGRCRRCGFLSFIGAADHLIPRRLLKGRETAFRDNLAWLCAAYCHGVKSGVVEPALYRGDVQRFEEFLAMVAKGGPIPSRALLARAYGRLLKLQA